MERLSHKGFFCNTGSVGKEIIAWLGVVESLGLVMDDQLRDDGAVDLFILSSALDYVVAIKKVLMGLGPDFIDFVDERAESPVDLFIGLEEKRVKLEQQFKPVSPVAESAPVHDDGIFSGHMDNESDDIDDCYRAMYLDAVLKGYMAGKSGHE